VPERPDRGHVGSPEQSVWLYENGHLAAVAPMSCAPVQERTLARAPKSVGVSAVSKRHSYLGAPARAFEGVSAWWLVLTLARWRTNGQHETRSPGRDRHV
jgi:hypothetical protein